MNVMYVHNDYTTSLLQLYIYIPYMVCVTCRNMNVSHVVVTIFESLIDTHSSTDSLTRRL
jgi:hypothetical protein